MKLQDYLKQLYRQDYTVSHIELNEERNELVLIVKIKSNAMLIVHPPKKKPDILERVTISIASGEFVVIEKKFAKYNPPKEGYYEFECTK